MSYTIVRSSVSHVGLLAPMFDAYRQFYGMEPDKRSGTFITERLEREESVVFVAIEDSTLPLGFVQLYPLFSSVRLSRIWILNDLFVVTDARNQGVGTALLRAAEAFAAETGASSLSLSTEKSNFAAKSLYRSLGWIVDEQFDHFQKQL